MSWLDSMNKSNLIQKGDYGIRVARPGYDASSCEENQLIFNSGWPILQIAGAFKYTDFDALPNEGKYREYDSDWNYVTEHASLPSGFTLAGSYPVSMGVNSQYIRSNGYYDKYTNGSRIILYSRFKVMPHGMEYTPLYIPSSMLSEAGVVIITNVNIEKDVDYPYAESATQFLEGSTDYGIKSSSIFSGVDGLSTAQFSKLVQCVKTYDSKSTSNKVIYWSPLSEGYTTDDATGCLLPYEFISMACGAYNNADSGYYYDDYYTYDVWSAVGSDLQYAGSYSDALAIQTYVGNGSYYGTNRSLIVLRSPMVSPEYKEVNLS